MLQPHRKDMFDHIVAGAATHFLCTQQKANTEDESFRQKGANKTLNQLIINAYCRSKSEIEQPITPFEDIFAQHLREELINYAAKGMPSNLTLWVNGIKCGEGLLTICCFILFITGMILFSQGAITFPYFTASFLIGGVFGMVSLDEVEKKVLNEKERLEQEKADDILATFKAHKKNADIVDDKALPPESGSPVRL